MSRRGVLAVATLVGCAVAGCGAHGASDDVGDAAVLVRVSVRQVEVRRFVDAITVNGQWRSSGDVVIAAPFAATVESIGPRAGDAVTRGERLGWLVTRESKAALRGAELLEKQARSPAERDEARRALELARRDLVRVPLVAPRSGTVTRRAIEDGAEAAEGAELLTLMPRAALVCEVHVPAAGAGRLRTGQPAELREEGGSVRTATVQRVLPSASPSDQTTLVWLAPAERGPAPALDRFVVATIVLGPTHDAPAVPDSAVVEDDLTATKRVAVVGRDSVAIWTPVSLGAEAPGWHELLKPALPPGTRVIVVGQHGLPDSTRVGFAP